jgi:hypothetical protein
VTSYILRGIPTLPCKSAVSYGLSKPLTSDFEEKWKSLEPTKDYCKYVRFPFTSGHIVDYTVLLSDRRFAKESGSQLVGA